jgi:hypothetical protein
MSYILLNENLKSFYDLLKDKGSESDQFDWPNDLAFDNEGNLYVSDQNNHRIQMFAITDNHACSPASTNKISFFFLVYTSLFLFYLNNKFISTEVSKIIIAFF